jgi:hypothetical protein
MSRGSVQDAAHRPSKPVSIIRRVRMLLPDVTLEQGELSGFETCFPFESFRHVASTPLFIQRSHEEAEELSLPHGEQVQAGMNRSTAKMRCGKELRPIISSLFSLGNRSGSPMSGEFIQMIRNLHQIPIRSISLNDHSRRHNHNFALSGATASCIPNGPAGPSTCFEPLCVSTFLRICRLEYGLLSSNLM